MSRLSAAAPRKLARQPQDLIFRDLFYELEGFSERARVIAKLEGFNITGSIKIKTALALLDDAERLGGAVPGKTTIVESSSGNLGVALSCACQQRGYRFICATDPSMSRSNLLAMRAYGAQIVSVSEPHPVEGFVGARIARVRQIVLEEPDCLWLNQYANPANKGVHARETAREILAHIPRPDWLVLGVGTSGTFMGCAEVFRRESPSTRLVAVDPVGSVIFGGPAGVRRIPGLGGGRVPELLDTTLPDQVIQVEERETIRACRHIARNYSLLLGGSSGTVLAAVRALESQFQDGQTVVVIAPDTGDKYLDTIYDDDWVIDHYGALPTGY
ncbi:2,3-diaminopropionate biosynthesis protein SbnA [Pseudomonas sp. S3E17]|uniref:2,3-diaminopropionate biosynthesis protein SbnA n=1 Tax=Pseudomonas sp. S3E17 TaxID=2817893 RepID=UPI00209CE7D4|nr:2,3-diaminopropionate biosynthesis protein SbnA [Pseudomonas sp. S3E17]MCP1462299.1 cysteine synthase A [Pseudomonas sp. S3E17]